MTTTETNTTPLSVLKLSTRAYNRLRGAGIHDVETLAQTSDERLMDIKNFGEVALQEVREKLRRYQSGAL